MNTTDATRTSCALLLQLAAGEDAVVARKLFFFLYCDTSIVERLSVPLPFNDHTAKIKTIPVC